ncbi:protein-tyrosine-phosphatase [Fulvivirga ligni]|uniref:protein-tyrosine-phosphatase n=1 Tax=Fulvivirga ligni TaxID=2904246 RepID=UPI001F3A7486|nr:protein-tyrosine-phosphatase [Fulvivirga ligni]UII24006.1 protein-tyrosine-phosphatase [Fulvivirga ligni]
MSSIKFYPELSQTIERALKTQISDERKAVLQELINYISKKLSSNETAHLNFICTHNSRRSQFSQIWAQTAAAYFAIPVKCYSGGVEVTAFNERAVKAIKGNGFKVSASGDDNPLYLVSYSDNAQPIKAFSKLFDDAENNCEAFAAVMTCSHADENCPFIPGTEQRIAVRYEDPKSYDDTAEEADQYDFKSMEIAAEMLYVFSLL